MKASSLLEVIRLLLEKDEVYVAINQEKDGFIIGTKTFVTSELEQSYDGSFDVYITGEEQCPSDPNSLN